MINNQKIFAIIPARKGSKRLKNKNIILFNNKPLIYWTIKSAKKSKYIDNIFVSTNSKKISKISEVFGIKVPYLRPQSLSGDKVLIRDVVSYTLKKNKTRCSYIIILQPTSPLRDYKDIDKAIKLIDLKKYDALVTVTRDQRINKFGININSKSEITEIQKTTNNKKNFKYKLNGSIYIFKKEFFNKNKKFYDLKSFALITKKEKSIDIDTVDDITEAEKLIKYEL